MQVLAEHVHKPKIIGWIDYADADNCGYMDASEMGVDKFMEYEQAVIEEIRRRGYKFTGFYHQNGEHGVPLFEDNVVYRVTQRTWGAIMAEALGLDLSDRFSYLKWYIICPDGEQQILPEESRHHSILFQ